MLHDSIDHLYDFGISLNLDPRIYQSVCFGSALLYVNPNVINRQLLCEGGSRDYQQAE
jgi:hypothetical protein